MGAAGRLMKVERRHVRIGATHEDRVAIIEGIEPGALVVSEGQLKLQSGGRVRIDLSAHFGLPAVRPKE
jgi:membrane fusion protein, multidrug efflux system